MLLLCVLCRGLRSSLCGEIAFSGRVFDTSVQGLPGNKQRVMCSNVVEEKVMERHTQHCIGRAAVRMVVLSLRGLIVFCLGLLLITLRAWRRF